MPARDDEHDEIAGGEQADAPDRREQHQGQQALRGQRAPPRQALHLGRSRGRHELHERSARHTANRPNRRDGRDGRERDGTRGSRGRRKREHRPPRHTEHEGRHEAEQRRQHAPERDTASKRGHPHHAAFGCQHDGDARGPHAQQRVEAELALAPPHEKDVRVADEKREDHDDEHREGREHLAGFRVVHALLGGQVEREQIIGRCQKRIQQARGERERHEVDGEVAGAAPHIAPCEPKQHTVPFRTRVVCLDPMVPKRARRCLTGGLRLRRPT